MAGLTSHPNLKTTFSDTSPHAAELIDKGLNDPNTAINNIATELGNDAKSAALEARGSTATAVVNLLGQLKQAVKDILATTNWYDPLPITLTAVVGLFHASSGHKHTGVTGDAPPLDAAGLASNAVTTAKINTGAVT